MTRGIRGAVVVPVNTTDAIQRAAKSLLQKMVKENGVEVEDIACIYFTSTKDLSADFPARAVREMGWSEVPCLSAQEMEVAGGIRKTVRVLMLVNTAKEQSELRHQYLGEAAKLRPDLMKSSMQG